MGVGGAAAARLAALALVWAAASGFLPPLHDEHARAPGAPPPGRVLESMRTAREAGAAGGHPTLAAGAPGAHALVLLVAFADTAWAEPDLHTPAYFDSLLFGVETPSVRGYYEEISRGAFTLTGDVHPVTTLPASIVGYTGDGQCSGCCCGTGPYPHNSQRLVEDLVAAVDGSVDFGRYDGDGDGVVDLLFVVHAGVDVADRPVPRQFASHQWHTVTSPEPDGTAVEGYALLAEHSGIGGFAHEMTHLFGVPDLWDIACCSAGLGDWSLMATGARLGTPRYANPAHPDAWTRARLGFVEPLVPALEDGVGTVTLAPVETGGAVLKLVAGGREGPEYFLVENRRRDAARFDAALPGEGLFVYHVDERVALNTEPPHYKVALEQADGRFDLEFPTFFDLFGDGGDPFPGDSLRTRIDDSTIPSTRRYDGSPSGLTISKIVLGASDATIDVAVAEGPVFTTALVFGGERAGDGDLRPEGGERWALDLTVRNDGRDSGGPVLVAADGGGSGSVEPSVVDAGAIATGETIEVPAAFEVEIAPLAENPGVVTIALAASAGAVTDSSRVRLVTGDAFGLAPVSFETGLGGFAHARVALGVADPWHVSSRRAALGEQSLACADAGGGTYPDSIDAAATSAPILLGAGSSLVFTHWIDAESAPPRDALDGGRIEVSQDGERFEVVTPAGGYTHEPPVNADLPLFDSELFSGDSRLDPGCPGGWCAARVDLSAFDGEPVWVRFRFGSDGLGGAEGWFLDDVRVETNDDPVAFHLFEPLAGEEAVVVELTVVENLRPFAGTLRLARVRVDGAGAPLEMPVVLYEEMVTGEVRIVRTDAPLVPGERRRYRLIEVGAGGGADSVRAERLIAEPALPALPAVVSAGPTPFGAGAAPFRIALTPSAAAPVLVRFYDVAGRRVAERRSRRAGGLDVVTWDGRDDRTERVPAGVYFYRIASVGGGRTVCVR